MNNLTKILVVAFIVSIFIHFLLYFAINKTFNNSTLKVNTSTQDKNSTKGLVAIKYVKIKQKKQIKKDKIKTLKSVKKEVKKKSITKPVKKVPKKPLSLINLPSVTKKTLDLKKFFTTQKQEKIQTTKEEIKKRIERKKEIEEIQNLPELTQSYIKLYGEKFFELSKSQRRYLKQNLDKIGKITQKHLRYPRVSIRTKQQGTNVVEFYFHPNGDITELKISNSSQYTALDENTIYTIKVAYQHYPRPLEKIKIIINVNYYLY